jgi:tetratricopeptide (TPR) repeat protein
MNVLLMQFSSNAIGRLPSLFEHALVLWMESGLERVLGLECIDLYPETRDGEVLTLSRPLKREEVRECAERLSADYYLWGDLQFLPVGSREIEEAVIGLNYGDVRAPDFEERKVFSFAGVGGSLEKGGEIDAGALADLIEDVVATSAEVWGLPFEEGMLSQVAEGMTFHPRALTYFVYARRLVSGTNLKVKYYLKAIAADPCFAVAYINAARLLVSRSDYQAALKLLLRGYGYLKRSESGTDLLSLIALCTLQLGNPQKAIELWSRVIADRPGRVEAYYNIGNVYHSLGDLGRAEEFYHRATEINSLYPLSWFGLGRVSAQKGDYLEACKYLKNYIRLMPGDPWAYSIMGKCLMELGEMGEAEFSLKKAVQLDPDGEAGMLAREDLKSLRAKE